jgi:hypothetical protein
MYKQGKQKLIDNLPYPLPRAETVPQPPKMNREQHNKG